MKKNVEPVCLSPRAKAHIIGCLPLFSGINAGWKPSTPRLGIWRKSFLIKDDHPKQKTTSGLCALTSFKISLELTSLV